ncbi:MAG: hypothetical protein ACI9R3_006289 [Verrucomicrobiales bacterium]|jgi:hypothetical protein
MKQNEIPAHPDDLNTGTPEPPQKDHLVIFLVLIVLFIPLTISRAQTTDNGIASLYVGVFFMIGWILFTISLTCLVTCAATLVTLRIFKFLHPNRAHILFIYALSSFFTLAVTLLHFSLESFIPTDRISLINIPWQKVHAIPLRISHTAVAACLVIVVVANNLRIGRQIETSPPERANNIALWVGLLVTIALIIIVPWAIFTFNRLERAGWFFH